MATDIGRNTDAETILHASCVAIEGRGVLIVGASGSGKSALSLSLMAFGAELVADDRVRIRRDGPELIASAPHAIAGLIEARFVGLLKARFRDPVTLALAVDLDTVEGSRLPPHREFHLLGQSLPLLHRVDSPHFAPAILQFVKAGRSED